MVFVCQTDQVVRGLNERRIRCPCPLPLSHTHEYYNTPHRRQTDRVCTAIPTRSTRLQWPPSAPCRPRSGRVSTSRQRSFPPRCSGRPRRSIRTTCGRADVSVRRSRRQKAALTKSAATADVLERRVECGGANSAAGAGRRSVFESNHLITL